MAESRFGTLGLGISLSCGLVLSAYLVAQSIEKVKLANETVRVKGYAERSIVSDWAAWNGELSVQAPDLVEASHKMDGDFQKVLDNLNRLGVNGDDLKISPVDLTTLFRRMDDEVTNEIEGYLLKQSVEVSSSDVQFIAKLSRESSQLVKEGIRFESFPPRFYHTKTEELKLQMLAEAMKNAADRARILAEGSGGRVGRLCSASQGVFQITPGFSTEVSDYGVYDTTTIGKSMKAVVTAEFSIR